jgi:hypothetical protein
MTRLIFAVLLVVLVACCSFTRSEAADAAPPRVRYNDSWESLDSRPLPEWSACNNCLVHVPLLLSLSLPSLCLSVHLSPPLSFSVSACCRFDDAKFGIFIHWSDEQRALPPSCCASYRGREQPLIALLLLLLLCCAGECTRCPAGPMSVTTLSGTGIVWSTQAMTAA